MKKLKLLMLRWKMGFKCLWWMYKYRHENLVSARVYICSHFQYPHLGEVYMILDGKTGPCYQTDHKGDMESRVETVFNPPCFMMHQSKRLLVTDKAFQKEFFLAPFSFLGMESGMSLQRLKKAYKGHNVQFLYRTLVRL